MSRFISLRGGLLGVIFAALLSACSHQIPLNPTLGPDAGQPKIEQTVGVYMSPEFQAYEHKGSQYGDTWVFPIGRASSEMLMEALPRVFEETMAVDAAPRGKDMPDDLAAVLEPRIEGFTFDLPFVKTGIYSADIAYRFIMYTPDGKELVSWRVQGRGAQAGQFGFEFARWPGEATDLAMRDAMQKFIEGIGKIPEIQRWSRESKMRISKPRPVSGDVLAQK